MTHSQPEDQGASPRLPSPSTNVSQHVSCRSITAYMDHQELFEEVLELSHDQRGTIYNAFDFMNMNWNTAKASEAEPLTSQMDLEEFGLCSDITPFLDSIGVPTSPLAPTDSNSPVGESKDDESDPWLCRAGIHSLMKQRGLYETEQHTVQVAFAQLHSYAHADRIISRNIAPKLETQEQEILRIVRDKRRMCEAIRSAFNIYTGLGDFLDEKEITSLAAEFLGMDPLPRSLAVVLVLGVIAAGLHVMESQGGPLQDLSSESSLVFGEACDRIATFLLGHNSLTKLQGLVTLAIVSTRNNYANAFDLVMSAGACAYILHNDHKPPEGQAVLSDVEQCGLGLAVGAACCVEHEFYATMGLASEGLERVHLAHPTLRHQAESNGLPDGEESRAKWMANQIELSRIRSRISDVHLDTAEKLALKSALQMWKETLPGKYHDIDKPCPCNITSDGLKLWLFCKYHETCLRITIAQPETAGKDRLEGLVWVVLEATSLLPTTAVLSSRRTSSLVSLASCLQFTALLRDMGDFAEGNLPYLGMACGFFAKLTTRSQEPFSATASLLNVARNVIRRSREDPGARGEALYLVEGAAP